MIEQYKPSITEPFDYARAAHLLRRTVIGVRDEEIRHAIEGGLEATIEQLLTPWIPDMEFIDEFAYNEDAQVESPLDSDLYRIWYWEKDRLLNTLYMWQIQNFVRSPISLQERLWLCWHRHFALRPGSFAEMMLDYNHLLRKHSMGNFKELFTGITLDVEMQTAFTLYENYFDSDKPTINENYAREMMELYTCGIFDADGNRNYTQNDVREAARALTGWVYNINQSRAGYQHRKTKFAPWRFDPNDKTFLGQTGKWSTFDIVDILFRERSSAIAYRICWKLCTWLVNDTPDVQIVKQLAQTFIQNSWELKPVLRELLGSTYFFSQENRGVLKKSHIEYVVGMIRQFRLQNIPDFAKKQDRMGDLNPRLRSWGEFLHAPPNVSGWTGGRDWVNSSVLSQRMKFARDVILARLENFSHPQYEKNTYIFNAVNFAKQLPEHSILTNLADSLITALLPVEPDSVDRDRIRNALYAGAPLYEWNIDIPAHDANGRIRACLEQIALHPSFQLF